MKKETKIAFDLLAKHNPLTEHWSNQRYKQALIQFLQYKGDKALKALAGFFIYALNNLSEEKQSQVISSTFAHDLGQSNDEWMLPRSTNYLKYWNEAFSNGMKKLNIKTQNK